jgi:hypothetical protein
MQHSAQRLQRIEPKGIGNVSLSPTVRINVQISGLIGSPMCEVRRFSHSERPADAGLAIPMRQLPAIIHLLRQALLEAAEGGFFNHQGD